MASWMVHLRIADILSAQIPNLSVLEFIMGNIAPDSGIPSEDGTAYVPSSAISHFRNQIGTSGNRIDVNAYTAKYFSAAQQEQYDSRQTSFYLGYLCHLLTDIAWSDKILRPTAARFPAETKEERLKMVNHFKEDWYDLDFLYLRKHPDFSAFRIFRNALGFQNTYIQEFSPDAFDNRRAYITAFYSQLNGNLDREYPYLTEQEADHFVEETAKEILLTLTSYLN